MFGIKKFFGWLRGKDLERIALRRTAQVFGSLEKLQRKGLLQWDARQRRLFICDPLAQVMLRSQEEWDGFMKNVFLWQVYVRQQEAWERCFSRAEAKAVAEAKARYAVVTKAECDRIRRSARELVEVGTVKPPRIEAFEVFIIGDATPPLRSADDHDRAEALGQILAVGRYDPDTEVTEMAMWGEVERKMRFER